MLATPLPLNPSVEKGTKWVKPTENIALPGKCFCECSWEESLNHLVKDVLEPAGFCVLAVSRLPYLSEGDYRRSFYTLDDALLVLGPVDPSAQEAASED